jgi:hypothetical protein
LAFGLPELRTAQSFEAALQSMRRQCREANGV